MDDCTRRGTRRWAAGDADRALEIGDRLLAQADDLEEHAWGSFGNLLHLGHIIRGYALLQRDDVEGATAELRAAGGTPGSPELDSFGPDIRLAWDLLRRDRGDEVLAYFQDVSRFWSPIGHAQLFEAPS